MARAPIDCTHTAITVGTGSTAVLGASTGRRLLILQNISNESIFVNLAGGTAASNTGILLAASGGNIVLDDEVPRHAITAICASGSKTLLVTEGT